MRFEHDINDNTTIRNTTRWSRVKQDYLMTAIMGGASNITQPTSDVNSWTWSRTANTKDVSNKILTNQTNLTSTFYTALSVMMSVPAWNLPAKHRLTMALIR